MRFSQLGILPRLAIALLPWLVGEIIDSWFYGCFFSDSLFCIYYFHPPAMDVLFALLVLAPFIQVDTKLPLRILILITVSVAVHASAVALLVGTRGSVELFDIDTMFLNIVPISALSSLVVGITTVALSGRRPSLKMAAWSAAAGLPVSCTFLLMELDSATPWLVYHFNWHWAVWHLSICAAIYHSIHPKTRGQRVVSQTDQYT